MFVYKTFIGKPTYINHDNKVPQKARGIHFDSSLQYIPEWDVWKVRVLTGWDRTKDPATANAILNNKKSGFSMGAYTDSFLPVAKGTFINTKLGLIPVENVLNEYIIDTDKNSEKCGGSIFQGFGKVHNVETEHGFTFNPEESHPVLILTPNLDMKYVEAKDVKEGDYIAVRKKESEVWPDKLVFPEFIPCDADIDENNQVECKICHNKYNQLQAHITKSHGIKTKDYKEKFGAEVINASNFKKLKYPKEMTPELARIIGYILSDGCFTSIGKIMLSNTKPALINDFAYCVKETFGEEIFPVPSGDNQYIQFTCIGMTKFMSHIGVSCNKEDIPWSIMQSPRNCVIEFLRSYWESDGSAKSLGLYGVAFHCKYKKMLSQIQLLLLNLGMPFHLKDRGEQNTVVPSGNEYLLHMYSLNSFGDVADKFIKLVKPISEERKKDLEECSKKIRQYTQWHDVLPYVKDKVDNLYKSRHLYAGRFKVDGKYKILKMYRIEFKDNTVYCSKHFSVYDKLLDSIKILDEQLGKKIEKVLDSGIMWEKVVCNNPNPVLQEVYCIKDVENRHNFIANGFIVHNCSVCGKLHSNRQPCSCIKMGRGSLIKGKICYQLCVGVCFFETSFVADPADCTAYADVKGLVL
jgi:intein/homing endonuclease